MVLNGFQGYRKFYFVGGNASWANIDGLIQQSIDGLELYEEGDWKAPNVDVWGISDLELFRESNEILDALPSDQPFFAFIQTAGNRPFIPANNGDFERRDVAEDELAANGFRSNAQYNAVRLLDYNVGEYMKMARGTTTSTTRFSCFSVITTTASQRCPIWRPPWKNWAWKATTSAHDLRPKLLKPRVIEEVVGLVDVMPTVAGLAGLEYHNTTLGRDFQIPASEGERASPVSRGATGAITKDWFVRMNHDGSNATLHKLDEEDPYKDYAEQQPEIFQQLFELARASMKPRAICSTTM